MSQQWTQLARRARAAGPPLLTGFVQVRAPGRAPITTAIPQLGEALRLRSDNTKKIAELRARAIASAQTQEGADAPDHPAQLLEQIERLSAETLILVQRVNRTNVATHLPTGQPLVDALAERDYLLGVRNPFEAVAEAASGLQQRYMRSEFRIVRTVDPTELRRKADELARRHRVLDVAIQEANWNTDLVD